MDAVIQPSGPLRGELTLPPDKAICHRAVLIAAVADGRTVIRPWPIADDSQQTLRLVRGLGVTAGLSGDLLTVEGRGLDGLRAPQQPINCGESGTTLRLAAGLLAGQPFTTVLAAGPQLSRRPMRRIIDPLSRMGARIEGREGTAAELFPPLTIHGQRPLKSTRHDVAVASAQVKSALLFAGLYADGPTTVIERVPTRDHTERMLVRSGVSVRVRGREITLEPGPLRAPGEVVIPGDISSAVFFIVAAACVPDSQLRLKDVSLNPTRAAVLDVLRRMGAAIRVDDAGDASEPRGTVSVEASALRGITLAPEEVPGVIDELPALMVAAARAEGQTRLQGIGELRVKETDRIRSMVDGLSRLGARIRVVEPDTIEIDGGAALSGSVLDSAGDHRTAMSLAVAGLWAKGQTTIRGAECVAKSFPDFFDRLGRITGAGDGKKR